jgi:hypothetical protein
MRMLGTANAYGFTSESSGMLVLTNEEASWHQAIVLADTRVGQDGTIFGVSVLAGNTNPSNGQESGWEKAIDVQGTGLYIPVISSGITSNALFFNPATGKITYNATANIPSGLIIKDEGNIVVPSTNIINFVGAGVVASNANGVATITITNVDSSNRALISGITVQEEGSNVVTSATVLNFVGSTVTASNVGGVATINVTTTSSSSNASIRVSDEGSTVVATAAEINFVGAGVTTTNVGGVATVTIPGAGSSSVNVQDEGSAVISNPTAFNFVGAGVTATSVGTVATITIPNTGGTSSFGDYFPTGDWGTVTDPEFTAFGEDLTVMYDCRWEPITPRNYLLQKDLGYVQ